MINVLFVCAGNICRSPIADAVFQQMVKEAGLENDIMVDSAGTGSWHVGETAHRGTREVLKRHNIPYDGRARQIRQRDFSDFDYVLTMDQANWNNIQHYINPDSDTEVAMFLSYANAKGRLAEDEVPDPYYNGRFDAVYDLVSKGCQALLDHIRQEHNL